MKTHYLLTVTAIAIISIILNLILLGVVEKPTYNRPVDHLPTFVWNDDIEGLPKDGSAVLIEKTINDTVYLCSAQTEVESPEYQFTITDDSISVHDFDRYVGTVKIEGQLKQLINKDNE